jgi:hypothetical protein
MGRVNATFHKITIHAASYLPSLPLYLSFRGGETKRFFVYHATVTQFKRQNKRLALLCKPALKITFFYDDELLLLKQTYLKRRSILWGAAL